MNHDNTNTGKAAPIAWRALPALTAVDDRGHLAGMEQGRPGPVPPLPWEGLVNLSLSARHP